jgi:hypothetical protein
VKKWCNEEAVKEKGGEDIRGEEKGGEVKRR